MMKRGLMLYLLLSLLGAGLTVSAQRAGLVSAYFAADTDAPLIGQPFQLSLVVKAPADVLITLPQLSTDMPPFMVRDISGLLAGDFLDDSNNLARTLMARARPDVSLAEI